MCVCIDRGEEGILRREHVHIHTYICLENERIGQRIIYVMENDVYAAHTYRNRHMPPHFVVHVLGSSNTDGSGCPSTKVDTS